MEGLDLSNETDLNDKGYYQKLLAMLLLGLGSLFVGMLPVIISQQNRQRFPLTKSVMLCFGAGVLLATSMVHILPEVREKISSKWAEISLCGGFFIIYFIDELIHYLFGEAIQHRHNIPHTTEIHACDGFHEQSQRNYGSFRNEISPLLQNENQPETTSRHLLCTNGLDSHIHTDSHCNEVAAANARICHTSHQEPCTQAMTGTLGLIVALSLHALIEGLAIGVQDTSAKVMFLFIAVASHKFVMGFCLGLEFRLNPQTTIRSQFIGILSFSLGSVCGIGIGMFITDVPSTWNTLTLPIIQALAGGTLLYITVCEVIPREKTKWHQNRIRKTAGFAQFFAIFSGYLTMCLINMYLSD